MAGGDPKVIPFPRRREFPVDVLPAPARRFVETVAEAIGCAVDYVALSVLAAMSGAIGRRAILEVQPGWMVQPNLYVCLVGPSGSGKTPALSAAMAPLLEVESELLREYRNRVRSCGQQKGRGRDKKSAVLDDFGEPRLVVTEATTEALALALRASPRGVVRYCDELAELLGGFNIYRGGKGVDRQFYIQACDGQIIQVTRVNRALGPRRPETIVVERPFLTIAGGLVPSKLKLFGTGETLQDGLAQRFLFCAPEVQFCPASSGVPPSVREGYSSFLRTLASRVMGRVALDSSDPVPYQVDEEAGEIFDCICLEMTPSKNGMPDEVAAYLPKLRTYAARLALILQLAEDVTRDSSSRLVSTAAMEGAWRLVEYFQPQFGLVVRRISAGSTMGRIERLVEAADARGGTISARDVYTSKIAGVKRSEEALELFEQAQRAGFGKITHRRMKTGGRPQICFTLHSR